MTSCIVTIRSVLQQRIFQNLISILISHLTSSLVHSQAIPVVSTFPESFNIIFQSSFTLSLRTLSLTSAQSFDVSQILKSLGCLVFTPGFLSPCHHLLLFFFFMSFDFCTSTSNHHLTTQPLADSEQLFTTASYCSRVS